MFIEMDRLVFYYNSIKSFTKNLLPSVYKVQKVMLNVKYNISIFLFNSLNVYYSFFLPLAPTPPAKMSQTSWILNYKKYLMKDKRSSYFCHCFWSEKLNWKCTPPRSKWFLHIWHDTKSSKILVVSLSLSPTISLSKLSLFVFTSALGAT